MLRKKVQATLLATAAVLTCVFSGMNADTLTPVKANAGSGDYSTVYRLYNPNSGEHFYTLSEAEKNHLSVIGWSYEGVGWYAPNIGNSIYRVYNPNNGDHHYTNSIGEKNALVSAGWNDEGIAWYEPETHGKEARHIGAPIGGVEFQLNNNEGTVPIWRAYNPNCTGAGSHNYTSNAAEQRQLGIMGWQLEQVGWYGVDPSYTGPVQVDPEPTPTPDPVTPAPDDTTNGNGSRIRERKFGDKIQILYKDENGETSHHDITPSLFSSHNEDGPIITYYVGGHLDAPITMRGAKSNKLVYDYIWEHYPDACRYPDVGGAAWD